MADSTDTDTPSQQHGTAAPEGTLEATLLPALHPTRAERLRALERQTDATSTRTGENGVGVTLSLEMGNGDRIAGRGIDTEAALAHLEQRVAQLPTEG